MDVLDLLKDVLEDKIANQKFYNDAVVAIRNPKIKNMLINLRDEEMEHIEMLQEEIIAIEEKPFPVNKIIAKLKS